MTHGPHVHALVWIALLTGCTTVYEGRYDFHDGWRAAEVIDVGTSASLTRKPTDDCLKSGSAQAAGSRYAVVRYRGLRRPALRVVPVPEDRDVKAGDLVYLKVNDCSAPLPARVASPDAPRPQP